MMPLGNDLYAETLLSAARDQNSAAVQAAMLMIHLLDGDEGLVLALEKLTDEVTKPVPKPEGVCCTSVTALAADADGNMIGADEMPYELMWSLGMIEARLNSNQAAFHALINQARKDQKLAASAMILAHLAGRPFGVQTVMW
jgi:hypothetical protein